MNARNLLAMMLVLPLSVSALAGPDKAENSKKMRDIKRAEQHQIRDDRSDQRAVEMEQRRAECVKNSEQAECLGLQKGRKK